MGLNKAAKKFRRDCHQQALTDSDNRQKIQGGCRKQGQPQILMYKRSTWGSQAHPTQTISFWSFCRETIHKFTLQIPFTVSPMFLFNVVAPEMLSSPQRALLASASHLGAVLEACPSEKQTRREILDYGLVELWRHAKNYLT